MKGARHIVAGGARKENCWLLLGVLAKIWDWVAGKGEVEVVGWILDSGLGLEMLLHAFGKEVVIAVEEISVR